MRKKIIIDIDKCQSFPLLLNQWTINYVVCPGGRIRFKSGDEVTVKGSWVTSQKEPFMIVLQVSKGSDSFRLRQKDGTPIWGDWKSGRNEVGASSRE